MNHLEAEQNFSGSLMQEMWQLSNKTPLGIVIYEKQGYPILPRAKGLVQDTQVYFGGNLNEMLVGELVNGCQNEFFRRKQFTQLNYFRSRVFHWNNTIFQWVSSFSRAI